MSTVVPPPSQPRRKGVDPCHRHGDLLGGYADPEGVQREIVSLAGPGGTALVVDRLSANLADPRLVAHLSADEPVENARIVTELYLADGRGRRCRALKSEDLQSEPLYDETEGAICGDAYNGDLDGSELVDGCGHTYRLGLVPSESSPASLRWLKRVAGGEGCEQPVTVREVVGALESYEPPRTLTARALETLDDDPSVSTFTLRTELVRLSMSPIVLNRGLRESVLTAVERGELSLSEIAIRCGRFKRDARGNESGETSWLARRIGTMPEHGRDSPTRWVHSDVLALIARSGLGVAPREVEVG